MTSELRANIAPFTQFDQNIVINRYEVWKASRYVFGSQGQLVSMSFPAFLFCRELLVSPRAQYVQYWFCRELYWFCREPFGSATSFKVLSWGVWFCCQLIWFCREPFLILPWAILFCHEQLVIVVTVIHIYIYISSLFINSFL